MRPKKPAVAQHRDLAQARQEQLVLHDAVLDAARLGEPGDAERLVERVGDRLLAIDVLAGRRSPASSRSARICVEPASKNTVSSRVLRARRRGRSSSARCRAALGELRDLLGVAADQDRVGHHAVAVRQRDAALLADRQDRAHEVLVVAHAPGDAVHDDAEPCVAMASLPVVKLCRAPASVVTRW